jgi:hypothetical protein
VTLPVVTDIPINLRLPIDLSVPINQKVPMKFSMPVTAEVDQVVRIPVPGSLTSRLSFPQGPMRMDIRGTDMRVPLAGVSLQGSLPWIGNIELGPAPNTPAAVSPPPAAPQAQ